MLMGVVTGTTFFALPALANTWSTETICQYDVASTTSGVPQGRSTTLVIRATSGTMLQPGSDMACTGAGSSRLRCTVGDGTSHATFHATNLSPGAAQVTLTLAGVDGMTDPSRGNNVVTLDLG